MKFLATVNTRHRILDATAKVVNKVGFSRATIDEIVQEIGISKARFLYYFPAKTDCFLALIDRVHISILQDAGNMTDTMPDMPGRMLKAYVTSSLEWLEPPRSRQMVRALENMVLKKRIHKHRTEHFRMVYDERIPDQVIHAVFHICAGLWATYHLSEEPPEEQVSFRNKMRDMMAGMIDDGACSLRR